MQSSEKLNFLKITFSVTILKVKNKRILTAINGLCSKKSKFEPEDALF
jgi:hypothetical protein